MRRPLLHSVNFLEKGKKSAFRVNLAPYRLSNLFIFRLLKNATTLRNVEQTTFRVIDLSEIWELRHMGEESK